MNVVIIGEKACNARHAIENIIGRDCTITNVSTIDEANNLESENDVAILSSSDMVSPTSAKQLFDRVPIVLVSNRFDNTRGVKLLLRNSIPEDYNKLYTPMDLVQSCYSPDECLQKAISTVEDTVSFLKNN